MEHREHFDREQQEEHTLEHIEEDLDEIVGFLKPRLSFIKVGFVSTQIRGGIMATGPVKLTVGQKTTATVLGFDQTGAPFTIDFNANPVTFTDDNQAVASDAPTPPTDTITGVSAGVANITATCGGFNDTEQVTVSAVVPVLSSIKIDFSQPA
jgi:hypothetical protein